MTDQQQQPPLQQEAPLQDAAAAPPAAGPPAATVSWHDATTVAVSLHIENQSSRWVQLVWINNDGSQQVYNIIEPGTGTRQDTFSTHVWRFLTDEGALLLEYAGRDAAITLLDQGVRVLPAPAAVPAAPPADE